MKVLLYILIGLILVGVIGFFSFGFFNPTIYTSTEIEVDRPVGQTYALFQSEEKMDQWLETFQRVEWVSGEPGAIGSVRRVYYLEDGEEIVMAEEILENSLNEEFAFTLDHEIMTGEIAIQFKPLDSTRTQILSKSKYSGKSLLWQSFFALSQQSVSKRQQDDLNRFKLMVESQPLVEVVADSL